MNISFKFDPEIHIGADTISMAGSICSRYGERIMIAAGHDLDIQAVNRLKDILEDSGVKAIVFDGILEDSPVDMADNVVELCLAGHCSAIIGFGGMKTQIISRMAAIMAPMRAHTFELLDGRRMFSKFFPLISIPTAGMDPFMFTGYFIVTDPRDRLLKSVISPDKLYAAVIVDNNLFQFLSEDSSAAYLFDGFFSAMETYCSTRSNFLSDTILERALNFYAKMIKSGSGNINADTYAQAAFLASLGCSISSPGIGAALALAINARYPAVKQACTAALLPVIAKRLISARPEKMARVASFLDSNDKPASVAETADSVIENIHRYMDTFNVQTNLKNFNISLDRAVTAAEAARNLEFVSNSPWTVSGDDVFDILKQIL